MIIHGIQDYAYERGAPAHYEATVYSSVQSDRVIPPTYPPPLEPTLVPSGAVALNAQLDPDHFAALAPAHKRRVSRLLLVFCIATLSLAMWQFSRGVD